MKGSGFANDYQAGGDWLSGTACQTTLVIQGRHSLVQAPSG